jgi:hypothetical protein
MENAIVKNVFTSEDIQIIKDIINKRVSELPHVDVDASEPTASREHVRIIRSGLGRLTLDHVPLPERITAKILAIANDISEIPGPFTEFSAITYGEYSGKYGVPELNPHKDNGECGLILDYQLDSNTDWHFGADKSAYLLKDNELISMYPVHQYHWRPRRSFTEDEYVRVIFFEFYTPGVIKEENTEEKNILRDLVSNFYKEKNNDNT